MKVIYDMQAYSFGPHGGIVRIFDEIIARLGGKPGFRACLFAAGRTAAPLPLGPHIRRSPWRGLPRGLSGSDTPISKIYHTLERLYWRTEGGHIFHPTFYPNRPALFRLPTVVTVYDLIHEQLDAPDDMPDHSAYLRLKKNAIQQAARILCISEATRQDLLKYYDVDPGIARTVHPACDPLFGHMPQEELDHVATAVLPDPATPFILYVGSRQRYKNFHRFLAAYRQWRENHNVRVVVVGKKRHSGDATVEDLTGSGGNITFLPNVTDRELCALYSRALFFCYPSLCEGFGIPLLEAMASNCALCISDIPVFHEVAGQAAHYFDPYSIESMLAAFDKCLADRENPQHDATRKEQLARFSWDRCAEQVWQLYEEVVEEATRS